MKFINVLYFKIIMTFGKRDNSSSQENILYELLLYTEWDQESDVSNKTYD